MHVPFCYFPDRWGGTEVYVNSLALELTHLGVESVIAAPARQETCYMHDGLTVYRFAIGSGSPLQAYGEADRIAATHFSEVFHRERPDIVHLHAFTSAVSVLLVDVARSGGAKVVFTYHTPTVSCMRGTLMQWGEQQCDGLMQCRRCAACKLQKHDLSMPISKLLAYVPGTIGQFLTKIHPPSGPLIALAMTSLVAERQKATRQLLNSVDHVVAVCEWAYCLLCTNGLPTLKLSLCRQGLPFPRETNEAQVPLTWTSKRELRVAFLGRLEHDKGPDVLALALSQLRDLPIRIDIYGLSETALPSPYVASLARAAADDPRLTLKQAVKPQSVVTLLREYDLLAVPSRGLETGPLTVLESFAAGIPVLGSRLGGIAELVRDGVDGVLVPPGDPAAWATALRRLAKEPGLLSRLRAGIRPPRAMKAVAEDMLEIYSRLSGDFENARNAVA
jgi:glycosyltransferase involved in cell wall biosynthesis